MAELGVPDTATDTATASKSGRPAGRILGGVLAIAGAAALVLAAITLPPASASDARGAGVSPVPVDQQRSCAGPAVRLGAGADGAATAITAFGQPEIAAGTSSAPGAATVGLANVDVPSSETGATPVSLAVPSAAAPDALLAAAQTQSASETDVAGLAAAACVEGTSTSWLLAGATDTGRTTILLLTNESAVSATVDLTLYTGEGPVAAPGLTSITVPPSAQRTISLAGYAPGQAQLAVGVSSRGGLISAALQQSIVRGLEPGGLDLVGATAPAATELAIPGVRITTAVAAAAREQVGGSQDVQTVVRLLSPDKDASASIGITPEGGQGEGASLTADLPAGKVVDVPVGPLGDGTYSVSITATRPVLASVRASTVAPPAPQDDSRDEDSEDADSEDTASGDGDSGSVSSGGEIGFDVVGPGSGGDAQTGERIDLAWFTATGALTAPTAFATAPAPNPRLSLVNSGREAASVTLTTAGSPQTVEVPAGSSVGVVLGGGSVYLLESTQPVAASVSFAADGGLASYPVRPANPLASPLTVFH